MRLIIDITRQDYADFNKFHFLKTRLKRSVLTGTIIIVLLELYLNREEFNLTSTLVSSFVGVLVYALLINRSLQKTKNIPDNDGTILGRKTIEFSEEKISYKTDHSEGSNNWTSVKKMEESSTAFYLYIDANMAMLVPKKSFNNKSEEDAFKMLVNRKMNKA